MTLRQAQDKLRVLDLFSGIGGFSLGLERTGGFRTVAFCEIEPYCRKVLAKHWPGVRCYNDVRTLSADTLRRDGIAVDVICGGFPCQDISSAGFKAGIRGRKSSLWQEYARLIGEIRPRFILVENVAALLYRGLGDILGNLAALGYDAEWHCIPASVVGAPHRRDRLWILGYPNCESQPVGAIDDSEMAELPSFTDTQCRFREMAVYLAGIGRPGQSISWNAVWANEYSACRVGMDDGVSERLDRLKALGNAVVPQIPELIGRAILAAREDAA